MHTAVIQNLCKHLGEGRAKRRRRAKKRSLGNPRDDEATIEKKLCVHASIQSVEQKGDEDKDPFGLDEFFANIEADRNKSKGWFFFVS